LNVWIHLIITTKDRLENCLMAYFVQPVVKEYSPFNS